MAVLVSHSQLLVLLLEDKGGLSGELWLQGTTHLDVGLELRHREVRGQCCVLNSVHVDNMARNVEVLVFLFLVNDDEEEVEAGHNWRADIDVVAQGPCAIISTSERISCSQDRGTRIEGGVDASFCNRDGLLLHSFVDSNLILDIHLVELINTADTVICEHQGTSFDAELTCLGILTHRSSQTCCIRGLSTTVDGAW